MSFLSSALMESARDLLKEIKSMGYESYIVGGAIRDLLLDVDTNDLDIATNCPMEILRSKFRTHEITKKKDFEHLNFGVLLVAFHGNLFEVAQFRTEKGYDGRRPSEVEFVQSLEEDVKRRDFTVNAMAMDENGNIIDLVGGMDDLKNRIIRAVGDPERRFDEDYLRMMRVARFAAKDGFTLDKNTARAVRKLAKNIEKMSAERISQEIVKAAKMSSLEFARYVEILVDLRLLQRILPEIDTLRHLKHNLKFHPEGITVLDHVIETVKAVDSDEVLSWVCPGFIIRIAALLHDVGKATTFSEKDGLPHYYRHEHIGKYLVEDILKRLRFPAYVAEPVLFAVSNHMLFTNMDKMKPAKVARIVSHPFFKILVEVGRADSRSRGDIYHDDAEFDAQIEAFMAIRHRWEKYLGEKPLNLVSGDRIMELTGEKPGRVIGEIKKEVEERIIERSVNEDIYELPIVSAPEDSAVIDELILEVYHDMAKRGVA